MEINLSALGLNIAQKTAVPTRVKDLSLQQLSEKVILACGDVYDLSKVTRDHLVNTTSKIPVICKTCKFERNVSLGKLIYPGRSRQCPRCSGRLPWTYESFIKRAQEIHGNTCDYSLITSSHKISVNSWVPILCTICHHKWEATIGNHIHQETGCPSCARNIRWTLDRFILVSQSLSGDKYDLSLIDKNLVLDVKIKLPLICKLCNHIWNTTINNYVNKKRNCPCSNRRPWNLSRLLEMSRSLFGDRYEYPGIYADTKLTHTTYIKIKCKKCDNIWETVIGAHMYAESGCPNCNSYPSWTLERFISCATNIHGDKYDYSLIGEEDIKTISHKMPIICKKCNIKWLSSISNHIYNRCGCSLCKGHHFEIDTYKILEKIEGIVVTTQFCYPNCNRRYDFMITSQHFDCPILIEVDGRQHFEYVKFFFKTTQYYEYRKNVDIYKTYSAYENKYYIIRLSHDVSSHIGYISKHIEAAFKLFSSNVPYDEKWIYLSDRQKYDWIVSSLSTGSYPTENPIYRI